MTPAEEQRSTLISVLVIVFVVAFLPGCAQPALYENGHLTEAGENAAGFICAQRGGIDYVNVFSLGDGAHVKCKDGLVFDLDTGAAKL